MPLFFARSAKRRPHKVARRPGNAALQSGANRVEPTGAVVREARERRPPVGTARRRRANHVLPTGGMSRTRTAAPVEVPVAGRTMPLFEVRPARRASARLCRPPPGELARGRRSRACASPGRPDADPPLSRFPPGHAGSEQSSLPLFCARQYATTGRIAGTAWNADLRSAPPAGGGRTTYCRLAGCPAPAPLLLLKYPSPYGPCRCLRSVPPAALPRGCADQRSAFPCLRVIVPPGDTRRREPSHCLRSVSPAALPRGCAGPHRENWPEVGVPLPARRRASKLPCAPAARGGKFRCVFTFL